jgi:hypothetical protein
MYTLVSLISDQVVPNLLFIKEMGYQADSFVFITTRLMKERGKINDLIDAAGLNQDVCSELLIDDESNIHAIYNTLDGCFASDKKYLVNLTGGTKIMFLSAYNYFSKGSNRIFYLPIGMNMIKEIHPDNSTHVLKHRITVKEYLRSCGINFEASSASDIKDFKFLKALFKEYKQTGYDITSLYQTRDPEHQAFFSGGWFEQYVYHLISREIRINPPFIEHALRINNLPEKHRAGNDNELDVVFTYDNELYVVEAKVSLGVKKIKRHTLDQTLFKLSALNNNFGLRSNAYVFTLSDISKETEIFRNDLDRKMRVLGIRGVIDRSKLINIKTQILSNNLKTQ